jgi:FkbM family methyltransferase
MVHRIVKFLSFASSSIYKFRFVQNLLLKNSSKEVVDVNQNFRLEVTTGDLISNYIYHFKIWEPSITRYIVESLKDLNGRSFVDIGANLGYFSILVSKMNPKSMVYSYEPMPFLYDSLKRNIEINDLSNVMAIQSAVSNKEGSVELFEGHPMNSGNCGVHKNFESNNGIQVNSILLLNQIPKMKFQPRIIKVDTEGSEDKIFSQLEELIEILPQDIEFLVEFNPELIGKEKANDILAQFLDFGFNAFEMKNSYDFDFYIKPHNISPLLFDRSIDKQIDLLFTNKTAETLISRS